MRGIYTRYLAGVLLGTVLAAPLAWADAKAHPGKSGAAPRSGESAVLDCKTFAKKWGKASRKHRDTLRRLKKKQRRETVSLQARQWREREQSVPRYNASFLELRETHRLERAELKKRHHNERGELEKTLSESLRSLWFRASGSCRSETPDGKTYPMFDR